MRTLCVLSCLVASTSLAAQTTLSLVAATPIAAMTATSAGAVTLQAKAQGQPIGASPNNVFLSTNQSATTHYLSAMTIVYPTMGYQGGAGFNFFERAYARGTAADAAGSSASPASTGASFGPHAVLATFGAAPGTVGRIVVSWRNNVAAGGTAAVAIDVGDDGIVEVAQSAAAELSLPYTFGASGQVAVRVANECRSVGNGTATTMYTWTELFVAFQPDLTATCTITNYGQGCAGAQLGCTDLVVGGTRTVFALATGCYASSPVILVLGTNQIALPLLGGCSLLASGESYSLALADGAGLATHSWSFPSTLLGTIHVQAVPIADQGGTLVLRASNGVRVACN